MGCEAMALIKPLRRHLKPRPVPISMLTERAGIECRGRFTNHEGFDGTESENSSMARKDGSDMRRYMESISRKRIVYFCRI
jgi:hypothetical protein